jgi:hypothetical protein
MVLASLNAVVVVVVVLSGIAAFNAGATLGEG